MVRSLTVAGLFVAIVAVASAVWLRPSGAQAQHPPTCGSMGPYNFNTLEIPSSETDFAAYKTLINLAAEGKLFPTTLSAAGQTVDVRYQGVAPGTRQQRQGGAVPPSPAHRIPPTMYYSVAWIESTWSNAANSVPWGGVGPVLRAFDCGFGLGQITSGMANTTGTATAKQALIGVHPAFNLAEGMRILADKWNQAPSVRPIAGNGNPAHLEDWYYALWSYNGFAFINHPFHPDRDPLRAGNADSPIYHCFDPSAPSYARKNGGTGSLYGYGDYTYPERAYGCMRHPPFRGGQRMWQPVTFNMPDFTRPEIAAAFDPEHFLACRSNNFSGGCPLMDYPTSFPDDEIKANEDIVAPTSASHAAKYLGNPVLSFSGPASASLEARPGGIIDSVNVSATNTGSFIAPFRVRSTAPWLVVTDANGSQTRYLHGSLAIGSETTVVVTSVPQPVTKQGHVAQMRVTLNPAVMPKGPVTATVHFEPLYGGGSAFSVTVTGVNNYTPAPPTPTPTPTPTPQIPNERGPHQITLPGIAAQNPW